MNFLKRIWARIVGLFKKEKPPQNPHVVRAIERTTTKLDLERRRRNAQKAALEKAEKSRRKIVAKSRRINRGTVKGYARKS